MVKKELLIKNAVSYSAYLLVVWGFYRMLVMFPTEVDELAFKPIIWLLPLYFILKKEKAGINSLGITLKNLFPAIYFSLFLGTFFAVEGYIVNVLKYKGSDFSANIGENPLYLALGISLATAISEEVAFRGYLLNRAILIFKSETKGIIANTLLWVLIHLPISIFWWKFNFGENLGFLLLTAIYGVGSSFVFLRTRNVISSILLHIFWEWPIILFR